MVERLELRDHDITAARDVLLTSARHMENVGVAPHGACLPSLTSLGHEIDRYVRCLASAGTALARASLTARSSLALVTREARELDNVMSAQAEGGLAVRGASR